VQSGVYIRYFKAALNNYISFYIAHYEIMTKPDKTANGDIKMTFLI